jgi:hypothetical protein
LGGASYVAIQKELGKILRQQYEPPEQLPHLLLTLLLELNEQETDN